MRFALPVVLVFCTIVTAQKATELPLPAQSPISVLTRQNDNQHTGQNLLEVILTPTNVNSNSFGKLFSYPVDGQIYAQPLYVQNVTIPSRGAHNVIYVATENDSVYALDADGGKANVAPLWHVSFLNPPTVLGVPCAASSGVCQLFPLLGITATPVINLVTNTLYVVARTQEINSTNSISFVTRLHALDLSTGAEQQGSPATICSGLGNAGCTFAGQSIQFAPQHQQGRPALILASEPGYPGGVLFLGFSGDLGWVLAYDASSLQLLASFSTDDRKHTTPGVPGQGHSGVWAAGGAITADAAGNVYVVTGDGFFDGVTNWGDALIKLVLTLNPDGTSSLVPTDYFAPTDEACRYATGLDFGSSSPLILPLQTGATSNLIFVGAKSSVACDPVSQIYVVNRDNMGHLGGQMAFLNGPRSGSESSPAYWNSATSAYIYNGGGGDSLRAFAVSSTGISPSDVMHSANTFVNGTTPAVSANGQINGIVWALDRIDDDHANPGTRAVILHAYDATKLSNELYNSTQAGSGRDTAGPAVKFQVPTVANGKVYVATQTELDVYGLCPCPGK